MYYDTTHIKHGINYFRNAWETDFCIIISDVYGNIRTWEDCIVEVLMLIPIFSFFLSKMNTGIVEEAIAEVEVEVPEEGEVLVHEMWVTFE